MMEGLKAVPRSDPERGTSFFNLKVLWELDRFGTGLGNGMVIFYRTPVLCTGTP